MSNGGYETKTNGKQKIEADISIYAGGLNHLKNGS